MAEIAPDVNVLNQVLSQQVQQQVADFAMERVALQSHVLVCNRTIDEQSATIEAQQKQIEKLQAENDKLRGDKTKPPSGKGKS